jgi:dTDP-4-dehydrorhamnose reductase
MRILITGAKGMLGQALLQVLGPHHDVTPLGHADLDVTDLASLRVVMKKSSPQVVIHAAAWTDVDGCERDPDRAFRVNALGSRNVAVACHEASAACCYLSTDYVFDGASTSAYTEFDAVRPLSVYGTSKLEGERAVQTLLSAHWIVRSSWLFGPGGKNFVKTILTKARSGEPLKVVNDQVGSPTYTLDLAQGIAKLIQEPRYGLWHLTNSGSCSWYELACRALSERGLLSTGAITAIDSRALGRPAPRPQNSVLRNYCWELEGWPLLRPWSEAFTDYLAHPELA